MYPVLISTSSISQIEALLRIYFFGSGSRLLVIPVLVQVFDDWKLKILYSWIAIYPEKYLQKISFSSQATGEAPSPKKSSGLQNIKFPKFFYFCWSILRSLIRIRNTDSQCSAGPRPFWLHIRICLDLLQGKHFRSQIKLILHYFQYAQYHFCLLPVLVCITDNYWQRLTGMVCCYLHYRQVAVNQYFIADKQLSILSVIFLYFRFRQCSGKN